MRLQSISSVLRKSNAFLPQLYRWHGCWRTVRIGYTYLNYEDRDYYETPLIHSVTTTRPDGSETLYYTYDERGNITSIRRGVNDIVCRYTYDDLGQLIREDNRAHGATYTWTYDNAGNILSSKTYAYTIGTLGTAQRTASYNYSSSSWGDLLTSYWGNSITYDGVGNPLTWGDYGELTWQGRRLMIYSDSESGDNYSYTYNADGIRTSKTVNGVKHTYHLSGTQILSEEWTDRWNRHVMVYIYDAAGQPIGMTHFQDGTLVDTYLYEKNIQGDVVAVYDYDGSLVVRYAYNAWGAVSETEYGSEYDEESFEVLCNPFRYRGYYYDTETDLYYLNSRYYDPAVGRFLNADGYINANGDLIGFNMFAYCGNNPVMLCDDCGEDAKNAIHNEVVDHAAAKYGLVSEEYLGRYGRCDLVDYGDLAVYEVKPISYMNIFGSYKNKLLNNQLDRYVQGLTYNYSKIEDLAPVRFKRGTKSISGNFDYGDYEVYYSLMAPGEIYYWTVPRDPAKSAVTVPGMIPASARRKYGSIPIIGGAAPAMVLIGIAIAGVGAASSSGGGKNVYFGAYCYN